MKKSKDGNAKDAIKTIKGLKTVAEIDAFISEDEDRKTVFDARNERVEEINTPPEEKGDDKPADKPAEKPAEKAKESPAPSENLKDEDYETGQSLGRVHDRENWEKGNKSKKK